MIEIGQKATIITEGICEVGHGFKIGDEVTFTGWVFGWTDLLEFEDAKHMSQLLSAEDYNLLQNNG